MPDHPAQTRLVATFRKHFALGAMIALGLIVTVIIATTLSAAAERRAAERWYDHTFEVLLAAGRLETALNLSMRGARGYLITGNREFLEPYLEGRDDVQKGVSELRALISDNAHQHRNLGAVDQRLRTYLSDIARLVNLEATGQHSQVIAIIKNGSHRQLAEHALGAIERFRQEEYRLLSVRHDVQLRSEARDEMLMYVLAGIGALLVVLLILAIISASRAHRRALDLAAELRVQATTDALTGLPNRRRVLELLETEMHRARRTGHPLTLALLDLDRFKLINDTHGHPAGDAVLRSVADLLRRVCRAGEMVGRFGGEEFAIVMPETSIEQARIVCERLRAAIARRTVAYPDGAFGRVTVSAGVAVWTTEERAAPFIARADVALYRAKQEGRNAVRLAA